MILQHTHRVLEASRLNEIANDDSVRRWMGGKGELDFTLPLKDVANIALMANEENGAYFFHRVGDGVYEGHSMFLPSGRGGYAADCLREAMRSMF